MSGCTVSVGTWRTAKKNSRSDVEHRVVDQPIPDAARRAGLYLAIQLHGVNPSALPVAGKGHTGRVLLRRGRTVPPL